MAAESETAFIDFAAKSQPSTLRIFANLTSTQPVSKLQFSLLRKLRRSDFLTSVQVGQKLDFDFQPTWSEVCFYSRQVVGKLIFKILSNLGRIIFFEFFRKPLLKMPFSSATTGRDFFCAHSPKRQFHRLPLEKDYGQKAFLTGYHLRDR